MIFKDGLIIETLKRRHMEHVIILLQNISDYAPPAENYDEIWDDFQSQNNVHSIVAIDDGIVVGYGSLVIETKIRGGRMGHLEDIVSHPIKRNEGIGKIIVNSLYDIARANNCYKIALQCQKSNEKFYVNCGYAVSGIAMQRFSKN